VHRKENVGSGCPYKSSYSSHSRAYRAAEIPWRLAWSVQPLLLVAAGGRLLLLLILTPEARNTETGSCGLHHGQAWDESLGAGRNQR
jgi:hypothetical protein